MDLKIPKFNDLKDRFGFKEGASHPHQEPMHDEEDDYDYTQEDYGEYAFDDNADYARMDSGSSMPKLITADDVRARTQYTPNEEAIQATEVDLGQGNPLDSIIDTDRPAAVEAAQAAEGRVIPRSTRMLMVIKPESYSDAERISRILKSGDVAVLSLRDTPEDLGKRILDFSFGVACALDARVECISGQVFALTRGAGLTEGEIGRLRDQGLM